MKKLNFLMAILASVFALQFSWAQPGLYDVEAGAFYFTPSELVVEVGSTVTWINVGGFHDVNFETNSITGDSFNNPESFVIGAVYSAGPDSPVEIGSHTFTVEGTYTYDCSIGTHAAQGMVGTIIVTPAGDYYGCMDELACNFDPIANIEDGSCLYNDLCCEALTPECLACQACMTPEEWCLSNFNEGCSDYDVVGCMDDGLQEWSPFPGVAADDYEPLANQPGECAYWGCGNPDNTLMLVGTFMDISGDNVGWQGSSMLVTNIWEDSYIYDVGDTVFYFSPTADIMYELPPLPTEDVAGAIDLH
jgi:plastocyanin